MCRLVTSTQNASIPRTDPAPASQSASGGEATKPCCGNRVCGSGSACQPEGMRPCTWPDCTSTPSAEGLGGSWWTENSGPATAWGEGSGALAHAERAVTAVTTTDAAT